MFTLSINTSNAAFEENPSFEVARILHYLAKKLRESECTQGVVRDFNGNTVGKWSFQI